MDQLRHTRTVTVANRAGLHARAALLIAKAAGEYQVDVTLVKDAQSAASSSMIEMLSLGARQGDEVVLAASGPRAAEVLEAIERLFVERFYEADEDTKVQG